MIIDSTICAPATIPGTGAITIIRVSGPDALAIADKIICVKGKPISETAGNSIRFGNIIADDTVVDEVLVSVFKAPHSYTGEDSVEISCHASAYICQTILELLCANGCVMAQPGEFTQRAFVNGKMDLAQAEAVADVISSTSKASLRLAMNQLKGNYSNELSDLRKQMLHLTSLLELELDFSEEEVEFADRTALNDLIARAISKVDSLADSFHLGNAIKNGVPVAIVGAPNTGKSTLLNALLCDDRAIVSDIAGTTRDTIEETVTIGGILYRFIDTAGIRDTHETIEKIGIERSFAAISKAEIVLAMVDLTADVSCIRQDLSLVLEKIDSGYQKLVILLNKSDAVQTSTLADQVRSLLPGGESSEHPGGVGILTISSKTGYGLDQLKSHLNSLCSSQLSGGHLSDGSTLVTNMRHFEALRQTSLSLRRAAEALRSGIPSDLVAIDLNEAIYHLGSITGSITNDEVLGNIFKNFCIGK